MSKDKITIMVVEDDESFCEVLVEHLCEEGYDAIGVADAQGLRDHLATQSTDLVLLDLGLPDEDGLAVALDLRRSHPNVGIIMVTARRTMGDRISGLRLGGDAYITKPIYFGELVATIESVLRRLATCRDRGQSPAQDAAWQLNRTGWKLFPPDRGVCLRLTAKEFSFLERLAESPGQPVSRQDLIAAIGANVKTYDPRSLDALVRRLRRKAEEAAQRELPIQAAHAFGYAFTAPLVVD